MFAHTTFRFRLAALAVCASAALAPAAPINVTFDFDALGSNARNADVQSYMNGMLGGVGSVTVSNALPMSGYTGDGYVVGPVVGGRVVPVTLGGTDRPGTYLVNDGNGRGGDRITMAFDFPVYGVSFDYQIFPSAGWQQNTPDFSFWADGVQVFRKVGVVPGQDGTFAHSPNSGLGANEAVPQFVGSFAIDFGGMGVTRLEFVDWPVRIGIDNLTLRGPRPAAQDPAIPEPATVAVCAALAGALGLGWVRRRTG